MESFIFIQNGEQFTHKLDNKAWRPWGIPTQECVKCSLK